MDTALKQRLIGAVVLVALAVIFLPMLVKGPAPDSGVSDVPLEVPAAPDAEYETRELPLVTPGSAPAQGAVGLDGRVAAPAAEPAPAEGVLQPPATAGGDFAVSFGAYATQADADAVLARVKQAKLPGFVEPATINGKPAFRVRVGPYVDRAQAEAARLDAIKVRGDVNAQVVTLDAATPDGTPVPSPAPSVATATPSTPTVTTQALPPEPAKPVANTKRASCPWSRRAVRRRRVPSDWMVRWPRLLPSLRPPRARCSRRRRQAAISPSASAPTPPRPMRTPSWPA